MNHDIHFRPGIAPDGTDTYSPRALIYDLKGAFGSLRQISALYETQEQQDAARNSLWCVTSRIAPSDPRLSMTNAVMYLQYCSIDVASAFFL